MKNTEKEKLAFELCQMYGSDQGIRNINKNKISMGYMQSIDTFNFNKLVNIVRNYGYPNKKLLGKYFKNECVQATAGVVLLHNPHRLVNEKEYFDLFFNEVKKGNMKIESFVLVLDKYYWVQSHGNNVLYGSQFGKPCLENKEKTNEARQKIGLSPLKDDEFKKCNEE